MNQRELMPIVNRCKQELLSIGLQVPAHPVIEYRVTGRMTSAYGNHNERRLLSGEVLSRTISISKDVPANIANQVVMHELLHAIAGGRAGHGPAFQRLARIVNAKLGYNIGTYASEEEVRAVQSVRDARKGTLICTKCGKHHKVGTGTRAYRMYQNFHCKCGGSLIKG